VLLFSAAAAFCARLYLPSTPVDRALFTTVIRSTANPPFIISGDGSRAQPWSLRVLSPYQKADPASAPVVISLGDDPDGIFQSSPPSPVDLAIILKNLRRLGATQAAVSAILAWEKPEPIDLAALDGELANFSRIVTAAPLSRAANTSAIPPTFRRASLALDQIQGDTSVLPTVNRVSLPGVILGGEKALSGFSLIEQEPAESTPLIARWDDRAVFAFPLLAVLAQYQLPLEGIQIDLGNFIKLSANGPIIPIDAYGRLTTPLGKSGQKTIAADAVIDRQEPLGPNHLILLRDDQSNAETATRDFSRKVAPLIADMASGAGMSTQEIFRRLAEPWEIALLSAVALLLAIFALRPSFPRQIGFALIAALIIIVDFIAASAASIWLPGMAALAAVFTAFLVSRLFFREAVTAPAAAPQVVMIPEIIPEPQPVVVAIAEPEAPPAVVTAIPPAKKAAAKKSTVAKKAAAKKTPAAKKSAGRKRSPTPPEL
jgi:hypothetical protein